MEPTLISRRQILSTSVKAQEMTEAQAIGIVKRALFENANKLYNLGLTPHVPNSIYDH